MTPPITDEKMREGYERTDFEIVACGAGGKYELPASTAARFRLPEDVSPSEFQSELESGEYAFIAPFVEGEKLSSKVYDAETNEFAHVKLYKSSLRVFPKGDDFSYETFSRLVNHAAEVAGGIELVDEDGN